MADQIPCIVCGSRAEFRFTAGDRFYKVTPLQVDYFQCCVCQCLFQWPVPDAETIRSFYPQGYWREGGDEGLMHRLQRFYVRFMLRVDPMYWFAKLKLKAGATFTDVGCSRGDWLAMIAARGMDVTGVEADERAADHARTKYQLPIVQATAEDWEPVPESQEAVSFFHLLEHLAQPDLFLDKVATSLKKGGLILVRIPNIASWQAKLFGRRWKGLEAPRHLALYPPRALSDLFEKHGFRVKMMTTWSLRDGPPAMASSLFPAGEPTRQEILGRSRPGATLLYLALTWLLTPFEFLAALFGKGAMVTVIARKKE